MESVRCFLISHPSLLLIPRGSGFCSRIGQKYSLVRVTPRRYPQHVHVTEQLDHHSRDRDEMRSRTGNDGLLLL